MRQPRSLPVRRAFGAPTAVVVATLVGYGGLGQRAVAAEVTRIADAVEVPADCPLARNEHPRLLFTRAQLPAIRARLTRGPLREDLELLKRTLDEGLSRGSDRARGAIVALGVAYHLTGDARYGEACRVAVVSRGEFGTYAALGLYGYDLVYDLLSPAERRRCEEQSIAFLRANRWRPRARMMHAVGVYGSGVDDSLVADQIAELYPWLLEHQRALSEWARDRGGDGNSHGYIGQHEYVGTLGAVQAWRTATGEDLLAGFDWARLMPPYYIYHTLPGRSDTVHVGINCWGENGYPAETGANNFVSLAQGYWRDGLAWWWIRNRIVGRQHDYEIFGTLWGPLLWSHAAVPELGPESLPPTMLFRERGYLSMRSDWSQDAVYAHFHCGRFEPDWRNNADNNSFIIYRGGYLACDTGTRGLNNPEMTDMSDGRHHNRYFVQTIAHNSITVGTRDVEGNGWTAVCGGQVSRPAREWIRSRSQSITEESQYSPRAGKIVGYQTHPRFDYVAGDATLSYSPDLVRGFTRQLLYVRPDLFVVYDRVDARRASDPKRWYLHTMEEPRLVDGVEEPDPSTHPEGHFVWNGTTGQASHKGSTLHFKTLLPKRSLIRKIGGRGHQFEVNGENYDMYDAWYERLGQDFFDRIGLGLWRVEVEPIERREEDVFLHVLQATDDSTTRMASAELVEEEGRVGARIATPRGEIVATFETDGPVRGHLSIRDGSDVLDVPLADEVQDRYDGWKAHPLYERWTSDPYLEAALTPSTGP